MGSTPGLGAFHPCVPGEGTKRTFLSRPWNSGPPGLPPTRSSETLTLLNPGETSRAQSSLQRTQCEQKHPPPPRPASPCPRDPEGASRALSHFPETSISWSSPRKSSVFPDRHLFTSPAFLNSCSREHASLECRLGLARAARGLIVVLFMLLPLYLARTVPWNRASLELAFPTRATIQGHCAGWGPVPLWPRSHSEASSCRSLRARVVAGMDLRAGGG